MQLNIEKNNFYKISTLLGVKTHKSIIKDISILNSYAKGNIEISLYYYDLSNDECFENILIPFELDMEGLDILKVDLVKTNIYVIENNGINVEYELEIEYEFIDKEITMEPVVISEGKEDVIIPIEIIEKEDINLVSDIDEFEQIKSDTKEYYEEKLEENLRENIKIISTKSNGSVDDFLSFFDDNLNYYKIKCIYVDDPKEFNDISIRYGVSVEDLWSGYDRENNKVIFKMK